MPTYQEEFNEFVNNYKKTAISPEDVGILICRLAQYYADANLIVISKEEKLNKRYVETANSIDESTLKPISVAKCDILIRDTDQYRESAIAKGELSNIEMYIGSLKFLQRGLLAELSNSAGI
jgi:hypothetical protein